MTKFIIGGLFCAFFSLNVLASQYQFDEYDNHHKLNYVYSYNAKGYHGYKIAKNKNGDGDCFKFTAALDDEKLVDYSWGDRKLLGKYSLEELIIEPSTKDCKNVKELFKEKS